MNTGMKQLLENIAMALVDIPEEVRVEEVKGTSVTIFELRVAPRDLGKVIGRHGRLAGAMRNILTAIGAKERKRHRLEILE